MDNSKPHHIKMHVSQPILTCLIINHNYNHTCFPITNPEVLTPLEKLLHADVHRCTLEKLQCLIVACNFHCDTLVIWCVTKAAAEAGEQFNGTFQLPTQIQTHTHRYTYSLQKHTSAHPHMAEQALLKLSN